MILTQNHKANGTEQSQETDPKENRTKISIWLREQQINEKITNYLFRDNKIDGFHYGKPSDLCLG